MFYQEFITMIGVYLVVLPRVYYNDWSIATWSFYQEFITMIEVYLVALPRVYYNDWSIPGLIVINSW